MSFPCCRVRWLTVQGWLLILWALSVCSVPFPIQSGPTVDPEPTSDTAHSSNAAAQGGGSGPAPPSASNPGLPTDDLFGNYLQSPANQSVPIPNTPSTPPAGKFLTTGCWSSSNLTYRGPGRFPSRCAAGWEQSGLLCYPECRHDTAIRHLVSNGAFFIQFRSLRNASNGVGPVCWRSSRGGPIGRGIGKPLQCAPNEDMVGALCYPSCSATGSRRAGEQFPIVGYLCGDACPHDSPINCGYLCMRYPSQCNSATLKITASAFDVLAGFGLTSQGILRFFNELPEKGVKKSFVDAFQAIRSTGTGGKDGLSLGFQISQYPDCS